MVFPIQQGAESKSRSIIDLYNSVRARTMQIVAPLETEDYVIQTAEFMSPPRWHIGHTSWFFETLLQAHQPGYKVYSDEYLFYFNSYYEGFGARIERPKRGTRSRPTVKETVSYRNRVDEHMLSFLDSIEHQPETETILALVRLGLEHEMQHQELLVYDIKHLLCDQYDAPIQPAPVSSMKVEGMAEIEGGLFWLGYDVPSGSPTVREGSNRTGSERPESGVKPPHSKNYDFAFDNEKPAHQVFMRDYALDRALVSNGDYLEFIRDGGYQNFRWWFSEGWEVVNRDEWRAPLYWELHEHTWMIRDFAGLHPAEIKANEPVSQVSFFEASAFAKWAGKRLPTEAEWEKAAAFDPQTRRQMAFPWGNDAVDSSKANLFENGIWAPAAIGSFPDGQNSYGCQQMIGDVWEWTTSDYVPYPGFKSEFDEYNDKWFVNQKVLRGGSFATPQLHIRSTYRNFFHAHERWMVSGFRCAKDM
ncbi:MAG TPA: ergothioneine biosynthesis protein EgtB [Pyrinomonadaceae bacterium]|jgi:formylglycine-generating enzyme required for sulfatase activity|nr:ergothioneine biosynthesis protein EgtB [Pyrinomonadaceae bacterium]